MAKSKDRHIVVRDKLQWRIEEQACI